MYSCVGPGERGVPAAAEAGGPGRGPSGQDEDLGGGGQLWSLIALK